MFKAEVGKERTKIELAGDICHICSDLSNLIHAVNGAIEEQNEEDAKKFRVMFTKGFMDGICFDVDRKTMDEYLKAADEAEERHNSPVAFIEKLIDSLKEKRDEIARMKDDLDSLAKEVAGDLRGAEGKKDADE